VDTSINRKESYGTYGTTEGMAKEEFCRELEYNEPPTDLRSTVHNPNVSYQKWIALLNVFGDNKFKEAFPFIREYLPPKQCCVAVI
jgi:hypothetical protein